MEEARGGSGETAEPHFKARKDLVPLPQSPPCTDGEAEANADTWLRLVVPTLVRSSVSWKGVCCFQRRVSRLRGPWEPRAVLSADEAHSLGLGQAVRKSPWLPDPSQEEESLRPRLVGGETLSPFLWFYFYFVGEWSASTRDGTVCKTHFLALYSKTSSVRPGLPTPHPSWL